MLILLLLFVGAMQGAEQVPALSPPVATMTVESAKYCLGSSFGQGVLLTRKRRPVTP